MPSPKKPTSAANFKTTLDGVLTASAMTAKLEGSLLVSARKGDAGKFLTTCKQIENSGLPVDINVRDEDGMTALHHVAALGLKSCVWALIHIGKCDYLIKDGAGRYASELAIQWSRHYEIAERLAEMQAKQAQSQGVPAFERPGIVD